MTKNTISAVFPDLKGQVAIITGANRGIGKGIAAFFAKQKARLILTGMEEDEGIELTTSLQTEGLNVTWLTGDLSNTTHAKNVCQKAVQQFGAIDILINNAACLQSKDFLHLEEEDYVTSFEKNMRINYSLSHFVAKQMALQKRGSIVNISSVSGIRAHRGLAGYDAAKGAIDSLTRAMSLDLAPYNIRVNAIAPGAIDSVEIASNVEDTRKVDMIPLNRLGSCEEIGAVAAFLCSDAAAYITGQIIYVCGGLTAQLTPPGNFI